MANFENHTVQPIVKKYERAQTYQDPAVQLNWNRLELILAELELGHKEE